MVASSSSALLEPLLAHHGYSPAALAGMSIDELVSWAAHHDSGPSRIRHVFTHAFSNALLSRCASCARACSTPIWNRAA